MARQPFIAIEAFVKEYGDLLFLEAAALCNRNGIQGRPEDAVHQTMINVMVSERFDVNASPEANLKYVRNVLRVVCLSDMSWRR